MTKLVPLSELVDTHQYDLGTDYFDPKGATAYGTNNEKIGKITDVLAEDGGKIRYLVIEVGNWFSNKQVVVPVGLARFDDQDHAVYFDSLTKDQVKGMREYQTGQDYDYDAQSNDERVLRGADYTGDIGYAMPAASAVETDAGTTTASTQYGDTSVPATTSTGRPIVDTTDGGNDRRYNYRDDSDDTLYKTPTKLQLLEERLSVNKDRYTAGSVTIGKRVETRQESVGVDLAHDEVVIERTLVTDARPVEGAVLGDASQTVRMDLEAEKANVSKQAFVTEEVNVGKRTETEHQTVTDTVGREVLDVNKTGDVDVQGDTDLNRDRNS